MNDDQEISSSYYQGGHGALHHSHSSHHHADVDTEISNSDNNYSSSELPTAWSFADTNKTRPLSRDENPHATTEVFNSVSHLSAAMLSNSIFVGDGTVDSAEWEQCMEDSQLEHQPISA